MRITSVAILLGSVLTGLVTAMPSANENGVQARSPLYGPRPIRISEPEDEEASVIEARSPLYGPRPIRISEPEDDESAVIEARSPLYGPRPIRISEEDE